MAINNPYALSFYGVNDYVSVNTTGSFLNNPDLTNQFTIEFYAKFPAPEGDYILMTGTTGYRGIILRRWYDSILSASDKRWIIPNLGQYLIYGSWHHYAIIWDGTVLQFLTDGDVKITVNAISSINDKIDTSFYIGRYFSHTYGFSIDELRVWDYARAVADIQANIGKRMIGSESGLYMYLRFDDGVGSTVTNLAGGPNGTIYGSGSQWINGAVDLAEAEGAINVSASGRGRAFARTNPYKIAYASATGRGQSKTSAAPWKIASASASGRGRASISGRYLVLYIPSGVYSIDADNIFNRNQPISPDSLANYIEVWVNQLKPVAEAEEVYKTDEDDPFTIGANETKTVTIHYKKEPVTEAAISFVNAPPYATIDSIKHYAWGANVTVTSPEAGTFELVATGKPLEVQSRELVVRKNETSILENGIKKYTFDNPFVQDRNTARMIGDQLLSFAIPQADIEIDWRGDPALVLADVTMIPEFQRQGLDQRGIFYVTKQSLTYDGGLRAVLAGRKVLRDYARIGLNDVLFHYDDSLNSTRGIQPLSGAVATLRPGEGRFGGAVVVEFATYNHCTDQSLNIYYWADDIEITKETLSETYYGQPIQRFRIKPLTDVGRNRMRASTWGQGCYSSQSFTFNADWAYTATIYWRCSKDSVVVDGSPANIEGWSGFLTENFDNGWKRSHATRMPSTTTANDFKIWGVQDTTINTGETIIVDFVCHQVEVTWIASSFVVGSRPAGMLTYPSLNMSQKAGTFSVLLKPQNYIYSTVDYLDVIDFRSDQDEANRLLILRKTANSYTPNQMHIKNGDSWNGAYVTISPDVYSRITWTWSETSYAFYINDTQITSGARTPGNTSFDKFVIREAGLFDELLILPRAASAAEIATWYNLKKPFYDPYEGV